MLFRSNVNTASAEELEMLPGIGPRRARLIVVARQKRGAFASVEELTEIRGFSAALVRRLGLLAQTQAPGREATTEQMNRQDAKRRQETPRTESGKR